MELNVGRRVRPVVGNFKLLCPVLRRIIFRKPLRKEEYVKHLRLIGTNQKILIDRGPEARHRIKFSADEPLHHDRIKSLLLRMFKEQQEFIGLRNLPHGGGKGLCLPSLPRFLETLFIRELRRGIKNKRQDALFRRSLKDMFGIHFREPIGFHFSSGQPRAKKGQKCPVLTPHTRSPR